MSVLNNTQLASKISQSDCGDLEYINRKVEIALASGEAIWVVPVGSGGSGISSDDIQDVADTLEVITEEKAAAVNLLISTGYTIVSQNGYPN